MQNVINLIRPLTSRLRWLLPERLKAWLRGPHHSIEYRLIANPLERLSLFIHRLKGGRYIDWYANRLDSHAEGKFASGRWEEESPEYREWLESGYQDLEVCKHFGMRPEHTLFEFGTGHGLASKFFVEYLAPGNFAGNDASAERLRIARMLFDRRNLSAKNPALILNADNSLDWLNGRTFDYIWCYAVFVHVPPEDVEEIMKNFRKAMHEDTICLFSYTGAPGVDTVEQLNVKDWHHGFKFFHDIAAKYGCEVSEETAVLNRFGRNSPPNRLVKMTLKTSAGTGR